MCQAVALKHVLIKRNFEIEIGFVVWYLSSTSAFPGRKVLERGRIIADGHVFRVDPEARSVGEIDMIFFVIRTQNVIKHVTQVFALVCCKCGVLGVIPTMGSICMEVGSSACSRP